ncbi:hypothetical protein GEV33_002665 [Tenebrio molitor]|uniref:Glutathione transferase n=1 Tax=Tenebrio molitor TaxID=7067 RepID=A0A8J6HSQ6_TENMO|nr:hypothetical protein GEV33_002665 [Tenebrio molitor]
MAPTVYMVHPSPPVRAVLMTAKAIGLELDLKEINLVDGDHLKPEFLKINPQHTVPTLVEENGQVLWDSHAIMTYLVSKYGDKESLYPKDFFKRAVVDQRLHFESGLVFPRVLKIVGPIVRAGKKTIDQEDIDAAHGIYAFLETFLDGKKWIAGSHVTVADYSLISSISTLNVLVNIDEEKFPRVAAWVRKVEGLGEYAANKKGLDIFKEMIRIKINMAPLLLITQYSQPVRATLMTIRALGICVELKEVNLIEGEQLLSDFIKINPQHSVPTLVQDDGFVLWDSHAIMAYLVDKYGNNDSLYPRDLRKRAIINQRLHFDNGVLFPINALGPVIYGGERSVPLEKIQRVEEAYGFVEKFLQGQDWIAGDAVTIADFSIISSITTLDLVVPIDPERFPNVAAWIGRAERLPYYDQEANLIKSLPLSTPTYQLSATPSIIKMAPTLYMIRYSQPVRATLMTIRAIDLDVELKEVNLIEKKQLSSDYTKLNPQHTVPTLVEEDGFTLWDSHAIMAYLVEKYGKDDSLYPKDLRKRAIINQRLHFENGILFPYTMAIIRPIIYEGEKTVPRDKADKVREAYSFLEKFLEGKNWVAGDAVSIADFSIISSITTMDVVVPVDTKTCPNVVSWIKRMEKLPYYDENKKGLDQIRQIIEEKLK